jgi:type II secretory pathway pseudopilin PulG
MRAFIATVFGIVIIGSLGYAMLSVLQSSSGAESKAQAASAVSAMQNQNTATVREDAIASPGSTIPINASKGMTSPNMLFKPPSMAPSETSEYRNTHYDFALSYPKDLVMKEYDEGSGVRTITFENPDNGFGFQIFIKPYTERQVNSEVFTIDESSGVMKDPKPIIVGGVKGTEFYGHNDQMDDTREIWFIHEGYLFEVYTYKPLDSWLMVIMKTWRFL